MIVKYEKWSMLAREFLHTYLPKIALAIVILIVGLWVANKASKLVKRVMVQRNVDESLIPFLTGIIGIGLKILVFITAAGTVGIATTSFVAVLGAAGLAIGLALQGSLANFAGGVIILLFKPFKVGDLIDTDGALGTVKSITILNTILTTPDDNTAILPNANVANNKVINYTKENNRRVDLEVGVSYDTDIELVKKVVSEGLRSVPKILDSPAPFVGILGFGDSAINLAVRPFCKSVDYWDVYFEGNEAIIKALDDAGIEIPFPHQVVEIKDPKK